MERYLIEIAIKASGYQTHWVDAESETDAIERFQNGEGAPYMDNYELGIENHAEPYVVGKTEVGDFGDYPPFEERDLLRKQQAEKTIEALVVAECDNLPNMLQNAYLIAAAPELLDALRDMMTWFAQLEDWSGVGDPNIEKCRAAINKAIGKQ